MQRQSISVSERDLALILTALHAISPSGGSSAPYALARRLQAETEAEEPDNFAILQAQTTASRELQG